MSESLGKAVLELDAHLGPLERNLKVANRSADQSQKHFDALAAVAELATKALHDVKMTVAQATESDTVTRRIEGSTGRVGRAAMEASRHLERVKLDQSNAEETAVAGGEIDHTLNKVTRNANETRRALESVRLAAARNPGRGLGPFGSGFGRVGLLGAGIGAGVLTAPAAGPGALGLLAAIPTLAGAGAGAIGTLVLALQGVGKAIGGDLKAFKELEPAQQKFVLTVRSMEGWIDRLKQTAASNLFPGLTRGLQAALSPGTLAAITRAVGEFGRALGQAGAMWGRYFGSARFQQIFGPLMQAGARSMLVLSRATLSLFDALGVLGRAAIPFTNWLTDSAAKGAAWLSRFVRAKEATGGLSHALREAQVSLRLVARLVQALWHAVYALGAALYPVSKGAVKSLTNGLNALAGILHRNQGAIRAVVGTLVGGFISAVRIGAQGVRLFNAGLAHFVGSKATIITTITLIGLTLAAALGPESAAIAGVLLAIGFITKKWDAFKTFFAGLMQSLQGIAKVGIGGMLVTFAVLASGAAKVLGWIPGIGGKIKHALNGVSDFVHGLISSGTADIKAGGGLMGSALESAFSPGKKGFLGFGSAVGTAVGSALSNAAANPAADVTAPDKTSPFGKQPPWTKNLGPKAKVLHLPMVSGSVQLGDRATALAGIRAGAGLEGEAQAPSGDNLLSLAARLRIDKAKMTVSKLDDFRAYSMARAEVEKLAKAMRGSNRLAIADELAKLAESTNRLKENFDGFNLTLAEQKRHSLDARYADKYHKRAGEAMTGTPGPAVYAPTFHSTDEQGMKREARRDWFRFRQTVMAG